MNATAASLKPRGAREAFWITSLYFIVSTVWILFSDELVKVLVQDPDARMTVSMVKGTGFVALTGWLLYIVLRQAFRSFSKESDLRQEAEHALLEHEQRLSTMFQIASVGMAQADPNTGRWLQVNEKLCQITGYSAPELLGLRILDLTHPDDQNADRTAFERVIRGEDANYRIEKRYIRKDGKVVWVNVNMTVVRDGAGRPQRTFATIEDIDVRKRAEATLAEREEQLRQSQKMEAIGLLAGGVAHDFNNILTSVIMQVEVIGATTNLPERVQRGLRQIRSDADRAANLTRQLLLFSRRQVIQPLVLNLNLIVANITKMLQRIIGEEVQLRLDLSTAPLMIYADAGMLEQVLMNLTVNARDAMPSGGTVTIATSVATVDKESARENHEASSGSFACISVRDEGTGIPPDILPRVFEPFFTTKPAHKGTGLGLATVFGIVKQHRGWIHLDNRPGQGLNVQVFLPLTRVAEAAPAPLAAKPELRRATETILVVEDEDALRLPICTVLEQQGYTVLGAANGPEALRVWEGHRGKIDAIITDLVMPGGISGQKLARHLQEAQPELKVIFATGYSPEFAGRELHLKPGEILLQKPFTADHLLATIRRLLDEPGSSSGESEAGVPPAARI